jgi:ribonuclease P protein component
MLQTRNRLRKRTDIMKVHEKGTTFFTPFLVLKYVKNKLPLSRVAVIVSTKVHKGAVKRNRLRRVIQGQLKDMNIKEGYDIIISTTPKCFGEGGVLQRKEILKTLHYAFEKSNLIG